MRKIITTHNEEIPVDGPKTIHQICGLINADGLDTVRLAGGMVMLVDDIGYDKGLAINEQATALYLARCRPGTTHVIRGDVYIAPDADFGRPF